MSERVILHCDCNNFYASVELLKQPELVGKPVAVSGSVNERHGIILAKNEIAKQYHVNTAETVWSAKQKCPGLILLAPHHDEYRRISRQINNIYGKYTDRVEPFGIDESWLDVSGSWHLFGSSPREVADRIRFEIQDTIRLTVSVGVSFNKIFAKIASDMHKPNKTTVIMQEDYKQLIWPKDVNDMLFIGKKASTVLHELGIQSIGDLALSDEALLQKLLGKQGIQLHQYANGVDNNPVRRIGEEEEIKTVGNGHTYKRDLCGYRDVRIAISALSDKVASRLRAKNLYANGIQVQIKTPELKMISRQKVLSGSVNISSELERNAMEILEANWNYAKPIRMLSVTATHLTEMAVPVQNSLFDCDNSTNEKREKLEKSIDKIRNKYGKNSIFEGNILHNTIGIDTSPKDNEE